MNQSLTTSHYSLRRFVAGFLIFSCLGLFLSGCFRKEEPQQNKKPEAVELVYYKLFDDEDVMRPLIQQYQAEHPNVSIRYRKFTDPVAYEQLIVNELAEGEGPDIFSVPNTWFLPNSKKTAPLSPETFSPKQFEETFVSVASKDLVLRDPRDSQTKVFGIPLTVDTLAVYYNKAAYEDKIPSRGRPPETWEELKDDVFQLSKKDNSFERFEVAGIAMGRADNILRATDILYLLMLQYKTTFYNSNISKAEFSKQQSSTAGGLNLNPATEALKLYTSFSLPANKNYSWNTYLADSKSPNKELETFARGKVVMIFGYSYLYEQLDAVIKDLQAKGVNTIDPKNIRIASVPQVINPKTSTEKRDAYAHYYAETVSRTSQHADVAWDFLLFLSSQENLKYYNQKTHNPTSRRDMIEDQKKDPIYGVFAEQIGYAESFPMYDSQEYNTIFSKAIESVLATGSPIEAIRSAEDALNTLLPSAGLIPPAPKSTSQATPAQNT